MNDRWKRHEREIATRDFQSASSQPQFCRSVRHRLETGAVNCRVTKLSNPCQIHFASEMPADHPETRCAAVHLVDLQDLIDFAYPLTALAKQTALVGEWVCPFSVPGGLPIIQLDFVVHLRLRGQQLRREIKRDPRFRFCLV